MKFGKAALNDPKITESLNQKCRDKLKLKKVLNEKKVSEVNPYVHAYA